MEKYLLISVWDPHTKKNKSMTSEMSYSFQVKLCLIYNHTPGFMTQAVMNKLHVHVFTVTLPITALVVKEASLTKIYKAVKIIFMIYKIVGCINLAAMFCFEGSLVPCLL